MIGKYDKFNAEMISLFQKILKGSIPIKGEIISKTHKIHGELQGRKCSFEIQLIDSSDINNQQWNVPTPSFYEKLMEKVKPITGLNTLDKNNFPPTPKEKLILKQFNQGLELISYCPYPYQNAIFAQI